MKDNLYYTLPFFINNLNKIKKNIDNLSVQVVGDRCELFVRLKSINKYIKKVLMYEQNFVRLFIENGVYAVFICPKKYYHIVSVISETGLRGCGKSTILSYKNKPWVQKSTQGFYFVFF